MVLGVLHLIVLLVAQHGQGLVGSISYSSLECQPQGSSFKYLADAIGSRLLVQHHPYILDVCGSLQQARCSDEEWRLTKSKRS
jgi:hypothetical protein